MKILGKEISFMSEDNRNFGPEISSSRGQAIGDEFPHIISDASPDASYDIPVDNPGSEIQKALCENQNTIDGNEQKRKRYHRYTEVQFCGLETFYKRCPHPNDMQREEVGQELGLDPLQVKYWFQNKHTQQKTRLRHEKTLEYRVENEKLLAENLMLKQALALSTCQICGGPSAIGGMTAPEYLLKLENDKLREEIKRIWIKISKDSGMPWTSSGSLSFLLFNEDVEFRKEAIGGKPDI